MSHDYGGGWRSPGRKQRHAATVAAAMAKKTGTAAAKRMAYDEAMRAGEGLTADTSDAYDTLFGAAAPVAPVSGAPPMISSAPASNVAEPLPESRPPPMPVTLLAWWPIRDQPGSALLGQADVRLGKSLILRGVGVWCRDGDLAAFGPNNVEWVDADAWRRFSDAVIKAVRAVWPGDLNK
jgi:hypothetical protein